MKFREVVKPGYRFLELKCPGCGYLHSITIERYGCDPEGKPWGFNGDWNAPTIDPSYKVVTRYAESEYVCHFFLIDGLLHFEGDCTHVLAGQTGVPPVDF